MRSTVKVSVTWPRPSNRDDDVAVLDAVRAEDSAPADVAQAGLSFRSWATRLRWDTYRSPEDGGASGRELLAVPLADLVRVNPWLAGRRVAIRAWVRTPDGELHLSRKRRFRLPRTAGLGGTFLDEYEIPRDLVIQSR
ncbi:MAG: hypothetical protein HYX34_05115 [Actinobacteria bacterium]|nr:hypothetical protein [Actinomycetota bacterium]